MDIEKILPKKEFFYPRMKWTTIDKPAPRRGDDFHLTQETTLPDGRKITSVIVTDSMDHRGVPYAKRFSTDFVDLVETTYAGFAYAGARISSPTTADGNYTIETVTHIDSFLVALVPTAENGNISYKPRIYPQTRYGESSKTTDSLPPGSIIICGSDGSIIYLAKYLETLYDELHQLYKDDKTKTGLAREYLIAAAEVSEVPRQFQSKEAHDPTVREAILQRLFEKLVSSTPLKPGSEDILLTRIKRRVEAAFDKAEVKEDDVTLLMAHLPSSLKEVKINPKGDYDLEDLISVTEEELCNIEIDPETGELSGKILGCEAYEVLREIFFGVFPSTRIPVLQTLENFFRDEKSAYIRFALNVLPDALEKYDHSWFTHEEIARFLKEDFPFYLRETIIEPLKSLRQANPKLVRHVDSFPPETTDMLTDPELLDEQKAWQMACTYGKINWSLLLSGYRKMVTTMFGKPIIINGAQIISLPPDQWDRMCHLSEDQFYPDIAINHHIKTSHLEWTTAVVTEPVVGENGGILFPDVLMLPSGSTRIALGLAYMQKYTEGGRLKNITNLNLPVAIFRPDRPIQEEKIQSMHRLLKE